MSRGSETLYDRHITVFSPEGKLYQVEYAFRAVKSCNLTAIAVRGSDTVCVVVQKKVPLQQAQQDKLLDSSSVTSLFNVSDTLGMVVVGLPGDCKSMVLRARSIASDFNQEMSYLIPAHFLCKKISNINQVYSQHAYMRLHACCGVILSIDEETGSPTLYHFDPAGCYSGRIACAIGTKEQEASNALEKLVQKKILNTETETIQATIDCLQSILSVDFKTAEIEVAVVTKKNPNFRRLTPSEIEDYLNRIAEAD